MNLEDRRRLDDIRARWSVVDEEYKRDVFWLIDRWMEARRNWEAEVWARGMDRAHRERQANDAA